jgi:excisionase family DNA binding protein
VNATIDVSVIDRGKSLAYSVKGLASALDVSESTIRGWIQREQIPVRRIGRRVLILKEDLSTVLHRLPSVQGE